MKRSLILTFAFTFTTAAAVLAGFAAKESLAKDELPPVELKHDTEPLDRDGPRIVSFADVLEEVMPAVVSVHTTEYAQLSDRDREIQDMIREYYGMPDRGEDEPVITRGHGSGFLVTADGYVLTNNHVIAASSDRAESEIIVKLSDGREYEATVVGADPSSDVAVLKVDPGETKLPFLPVGDSSQLRVGDIVFAVGNPLRVGLTVTQGIVSALERTDLDIIRGNRRNGPALESFIQTDAAINLGNSGGPLVDAEGRVIGINSAIASPTGGSIGIGFAIPINLAERIMDSLVNDGEVRRGFIGVELEPLSRDLALAFGLETVRGALINRVTPGLPAAEAGIKHGDVVVGVNGQNVDSVRELIYLISSESPESTVTLAIVRDRKQIDVDVILGDREALLTGMPRPAREMRQAPEPKKPTTLAPGLSVAPVDRATRAQYGIPEDVDGLVITELGEDADYGDYLAEGMVIQSINGQTVKTQEDAEQALNADGVNRVYVYFDEYHRYAPLLIGQ